MNPFPALTALFPFIFLSNLFIAFEAKLLTDTGKLCLPKEVERSPFYLKFLTYYENPPDWIILDNCTLLSFISVEIFLALAFLILAVSLVVRNNSCGNSSSWIFFLFILNIVLVLFFAASFNLLNCVFVSSKALRQPSQKVWSKILTPYFFHSNLYLHFLIPCF